MDRFSYYLIRTSAHHPHPEMWALAGIGTARVKGTACRRVHGAEHISLQKNFLF